MIEWISVDEKLPEPETPVLAIVNGYDGLITVERRWETCDPYIEGYFKDFLYWDWVDNDGQDLEGLITHWMPLPEPPEPAQWLAEKSEVDWRALCEELTAVIDGFIEMWDGPKYAMHMIENVQAARPVAGKARKALEQTK